MYNSLILNELENVSSGHQHSIIYDYEKGEKLCKICGVIVQDKIFDAELNTDFYKYRSDTNTVLPHSIILSDKGMSTAIANYDTTSSKRFANRKEHNKIEFLNKIVSCSNKKRNLKIVIDLLNRIKDKLSLTSVCIEEALQHYKKALENIMHLWLYRYF